MLKEGKGLPALGLFFGAVTIFLVIDSPLRDIVLNRFTGGSGEEFGQGVDLRTHIWNTFINNLEPINLVNGLGMVPVKNVYFFTVHNTYLGAIIYGGIWGVFIMIMVIARLLRVSGMLAKSLNPYIRQWSVFLPLLLIFLLVTGFSMENFQQTNCMQIFFGILAISEKMPALNDYPNYV